MPPRLSAGTCYSSARKSPKAKTRPNKFVTIDTDRIPRIGLRVLQQKQVLSYHDYKVFQKRVSFWRGDSPSRFLCDVPQQNRRQLVMGHDSLGVLHR
jgi:hypothetical protein